MGDALHTDGGVTSAQEARIADAGLLALTGPGAFDVRTGVFFGPGSTSLVSGTSTTAPNWTYQIATCNWVTSRGAANGPYRGALEQATTVSTALPPASNSRIDVIWVKQGDAASGVPSPDGTTAPVYGVTSGAAAPSPSKPAIPAGAVEIATAVVPSTATGGTGGSGVVITQTARQAVARGADIPVRSQAERDALTAFDGLAVRRLDKGGATEQYVNGSWGRVATQPPDSADGYRPFPMHSTWKAYTTPAQSGQGASSAPVYRIMPGGLVVPSGAMQPDFAPGPAVAQIDITPALPAEIRPDRFDPQLVYGKLGGARGVYRLDYHPDDQRLWVSKLDASTFTVGTGDYVYLANASWVRAQA